MCQIRNKSTFLQFSVTALLNQLFGFEVSSQVEHLPGGQPEKAKHGENAEVKHSAVCGFYKQKNE